MSFRDRIALARQPDGLHHLAKQFPYLTFMGIDFRRDEQGDLITVMSYSDDLIGNRRLPALHGGTLGALLELSALFEVALHTDVLQMPKTITVTIDYLRSGRPRDTFAKAHIHKLGRRVANVHVTAWQDNPDKPVVSGTVNFLLV